MTARILPYLQVQGCYGYDLNKFNYYTNRPKRRNNKNTTLFIILLYKSYYIIHVTSLARYT
jgi:hypothetical protein